MEHKDFKKAERIFRQEGVQLILEQVKDLREYPNHGCVAYGTILNREWVDAPTVYGWNPLLYEDLESRYRREEAVRGAIIALRNGGVHPSTIRLHSVLDITYINMPMEHLCRMVLVGSGMGCVNKENPDEGDPWNFSQIPETDLPFLKAAKQAWPKQADPSVPRVLPWPQKPYAGLRAEHFPRPLLSSAP